MELGTEDYYYQEHQYEDAHHEAVLAGDYGDTDGAIGGRHAAAATARAKRKAQRAAAQEVQTNNIRMGAISIGGPAVTAAALRRQRIAKIQDFTHKYIVRCRLPPPDEAENEKPTGKDDGFGSAKKSPNANKELSSTPKKDTKDETSIEEIITVEHLQELMLHFYESTIDIQALLQKEIKSMKIKSHGTRLMDTVKTKTGTEWQLNTAAFNVIKSNQRHSLALTNNNDTPSHSAALAPQISGSLEPIVGVGFGSGDTRSNLLNVLNNPAATGGIGGLRTSTSSPLATSSANQTRVSMTSAILNDFTLARNKKRLDEDSFIFAMQSALGRLVVSEADCRAWFRQIDVDNSGAIGWEEFSTYLLSLSEHRTHVDNRPFALGINLYPPTCHPWNRHTGAISCALVHPVTGTIYTGGEDGLILSWHATSLRNQSLIHRGVRWVVGLKLMKDGRLAAATVERELLIFDLKANELVRSYKGKCSLKGEAGMSYAYSTTDIVNINEKLIGHLTPKNAKVTANRADNREKYRRLKSGTATHLSMARDEVELITKGAREERSNDAKQLEQATLLGLVDAPTCLDYHYSAIDQDLIFFGTRTGSVLIYEITNSHERVVRQFYKLQIHQSRINHMEVIPLLEAILTCSDDCSLRLTSLETGGLIREFSKDLGHKMGVTSFVFYQAYKLFVSISGERRALVWDYLQEAPVYALEEHNAPLLSACINERDRQIITLSADNTVRISDLVTHKTLQTVSHRHTVRSSAIAEAKDSDNVPNFCTMLFDQHRCRHFVFSAFPQMYKLRQSEHSFPSHYSGHVEPVMHVTYSNILRQLISFDAETCIVWDQGTGATRFSFAYATDFSPAIEEFKLTCTGWDLTQRRLLCGYHQGTVVVWNYANGQALNVIQDVGIQQAARYGSEVAAVCATMLGDTPMYVYGVGRRLLYCPESQQFSVQRASSFELPDQHGALTALDKVNNHLIAIGTSTGALLIYNLTLEEQDGKAMLAADYSDGNDIHPYHYPNPSLHRPSEGSSPSMSTTNIHVVASTSRTPPGPGHHGGNSPLSHTGRPSLVHVPSTTPIGRSGSTSTARTNAFQSELRRQAAITSSRIEKLFVINKKDLPAPLIMVVHNDGRVVLWHGTKRTFICSLMMTGAGGSSASCFDLDSLTFETLAYCDTLGNITVWNIRYDEVSLLDTLRKHTRNPTVAADVGQFISGTHETIPSFERSSVRCTFHAHQKQITSVVVIPSAHETNLMNKKLAAMKAAHHGPTTIPAPSSPHEAANPLSSFELHTPPGVGMGSSSHLKRANSKLSRTAKMPSSFRLNPTEGLEELDHIDGSFLSNVESLLAPPALSANSPQRNTNLLSPQSAVLQHPEDGSYASLSFKGTHNGTYYEPTIATSGADCMVRLWTIDGKCIGEYGMKKWSLDQELSWKRAVPESPNEGVLDGAEGNRSVASLLLQPRADSLALLTNEISTNHLPPLSSPTAAKVPALRIDKLTSFDITLPPISGATSPRSPTVDREAPTSSRGAKVTLATMANDNEHDVPFHVPVTSPQSGRARQTVSYLAPNNNAVDELITAKGVSVQQPNQQLLASSSPRPALETIQKTTTIAGAIPHPPNHHGSGIVKARLPAPPAQDTLDASAIGFNEFSFMRSKGARGAPIQAPKGKTIHRPKPKLSSGEEDHPVLDLTPISPQASHIDANIHSSRHHTGLLGVGGLEGRPSSFLSVGGSSQRIDDSFAAEPSTDEMAFMLAPTPPQKRTSSTNESDTNGASTPTQPSGRKLLYGGRHTRKQLKADKTGEGSSHNKAGAEGVSILSTDDSVRFGAGNELVILTAPAQPSKASQPAIAISGPNESGIALLKAHAASKVPSMLLPPPPLNLNTSYLPTGATALQTPHSGPLQSPSARGLSTGVNQPLSPPSAYHSDGDILASPPTGDLLPDAPSNNVRSQQLAMNAVRERQGRLQQYGLGEEVKLIEQRLRASNNTASMQGRLRSEKTSAAEQLRARKAARDGTDRLEALGLANNGDEGGGDGNGDGEGSSRPSDGIETILRLSSQMMVVPIDDVRAPARSVEAQEEARRGGRKVYGVRAAGQSAAPTFTAPGVGGHKASPRR